MDQVQLREDKWIIVLEITSLDLSIKTLAEVFVEEKE